MTITLSSYLAISAEVAFDQVKRPALLRFVARPLIHFVPDKPFPSVWQTGAYQTTVMLFGLLPLGRQTIHIEYPGGMAGPLFQLRDNGQGHLAKTWDHWIFIEPMGGDRCRYTDRVRIRAGLLTPFVGAFARLFYAWRQYRWKELVRHNFTQVDSINE